MPMLQGLVLLLLIATTALLLHTALSDHEVRPGWLRERAKCSCL